jgi:transposase-like protein
MLCAMPSLRHRLAGDTARQATSDEVKTLRGEARQLKEGTGRGDAGKPPAQKKRDRLWGGWPMRYPATEKLEIIRTVETSPLSVRRTLGQIGIPKSTFYGWLDCHAAGGLEGLEDRKPGHGASGTVSARRCAARSSRWR